MRKLILVAILLSSCATQEEQIRYNQLSSKIRVLEIKQNKYEKELKEIQEKLFEIRSDLKKISVKLSSIEEKNDKNMELIFNLFQATSKALKNSNISKKEGAENKKLIESLMKKINALSKQISANAVYSNKEISKLKTKVSELEEKLNNLHIPSVKVESIKPNK